MRVLITGACGFIGRALIAELEAQHDLRLLDRVRPEEATMFMPGSQERIARPLVTDWPFVQADLDDIAALRAAVQGMDAIIHLAGSPYGSPEMGVDTFRSNALGTFIVLDAARLAGLERVLVASSINAFGTFYWRLSGRPSPYTTMPLDETFDAVPEDPYSLSKLVNEETCAAFNRAYGLTTVACRFAGVWTAEMYERASEEGLPPTMAWSDDLYQWVHVADIAAGLRQALEATHLPGHGVYTLGAADTRCPEPTLDLLRRFRPDLDKTRVQPLLGRAPLLSIDHAHRTFGYTPRYRLGA